MHLVEARASRRLRTAATGAPLGPRVIAGVRPRNRELETTRVDKTADETAEEVRLEYIQAMGPTLGNVFGALSDDVIWLHLTWKQFRLLYGTTPTTIDLLNRTAPVFFRIVQDTLWEDTLIHLCRLTDPPVMRGKENLSLGTLVPEIVDSALRGNVEDLVAVAATKTEFARDWRNRHIAHRDRALAQDRAPSPLAPASRQDVENALTSIREVMKTVLRHYTRSDIAYDIWFGMGGAEDLVNYLGAAVAEEDRERAAYGSVPGSGA